MRKLTFTLLIILILSFLTACAGEAIETGGTPPDNKGQTDIVPHEDINEPDIALSGDPIDTYGIGEYNAERALAMEKGGSLVKIGNTAVFAPQSGGIVMADFETMQYKYISNAIPDKLYFDGETVYYTKSDGIYTLNNSGESHITDDVTYNLWIDDEKIYYIKQRDLQSGEPRGELWCMNKNGANAVLILPIMIEGDFYIKDGWVYFTASEDGLLYRTMIFGDQQTQLATNPSEILFVTNRAIYYKETGGQEGIKRVDLKTNAALSLGAYGSAERVGEYVYAISRYERVNSIDNLFTLLQIGENAEPSYYIAFDNIGDDTLAYIWGNDVYLRRQNGGVYRIDLNDVEQTKHNILPQNAVFIDGVAYYFDNSGVYAYTLDNAQITSIKMN